MHPEGTRMPREMGEFKKKLIQTTRDIEKTNDLNIPVIPLGIEYPKSAYPGSKIYLRAGKALDLKTPNIEQIIYNEIKRLSGIK
jgi:hypothetical protein